MSRRTTLVCGMFAAALCLLAPGPAGAASAQRTVRRDAPSAAKLETAKIQQVIEQYLMEHPEVVLESIRRFQERYQAEQLEQKRSAVGKFQKELQRDESSPVLQRGAQDGEPVSVVAFFDYQCGYCKRTDEMLTRLASLPGVRVVYKEFPILGPDSLRAAKAALAASNQNAYQAFHEALMKSAVPATQARVEEIATELKLNLQQFKADLDSPVIAAAIARNHQLAEKLGVQSTPTFVIGNEVAAGALTEEAFQPLIEAARQQQRDASVKTPAASR